MQAPANTVADALSNPVRLAILRQLREGVAATLDELAGAAGVHRNTARSHAAILERARLIERASMAPQAGAGRPPTCYRLVPTAEPNDPPPLASLLGAALAESGLSPRKARRVGRLRATAASRLMPGRGWMRELEGQLSALGFHAQVSSGYVELEGCPCPLVSPENPAVVCALVSGTIDGALERKGSAEQVVAAEHDPAARRCTLLIAEAT